VSERCALAANSEQRTAYSLKARKTACCPLPAPNGVRVSAYYNEIDPLKAEMIRQAIQDGAIAPGDVDERSIADVEPADLVGYTQAHFFAETEGIKDEGHV
jgi:hypothetical protein